jgi:hypothetical protein
MARGQRSVRQLWSVRVRFEQLDPKLPSAKYMYSSVRFSSIRHSIDHSSDRQPSLAGQSGSVGYGLVFSHCPQRNRSSISLGVRLQQRWQNLNIRYIGSSLSADRTAFNSPVTSRPWTDDTGPNCTTPASTWPRNQLGPTTTRTESWVACQ